MNCHTKRNVQYESGLTAWELTGTNICVPFICAIVGSFQAKTINKHKEATKISENVRISV